MNVPLPAGAGDTEYLGDRAGACWRPSSEGFRPELILVSAGFDAHRDDPLAEMNVSAAGYRAMTAWLRALADEVCAGRLAFVLEGGYAASGLREGVGAHALRDAPRARRRPCPPVVDPGARRACSSGSWTRLVGIHGDRFPDLGAGLKLASTAGPDGSGARSRPSPGTPASWGWQPTCPAQHVVDELFLSGIRAIAP